MDHSNYSKETILVLGGTRPHSLLIKYLKELGYKTVLIDYLSDPLAKRDADVHYQESTLDIRKVEEIAVKENVSHIMNICTDRALPSAAYVAERLNLPHPYSYKTSLIATDKTLMKSMMKEADILSSKFVQITEIDQQDSAPLNFPLIVKPSDASGSIGISKVNNTIELKEAIKNAILLSRNHKAIIEEYITGIEIQIDSFVVGGQVKILDIKEKRMTQKDRLSLSFGSLIPARISEAIKGKALEVCQRIAKFLKLENCPLYIQAIVSDNQLYVIEFGLRIGGNLSFEIVKDVTGVNLISLTADAYLGRCIDINIQSHFNGIYTTYHIFPKSGVFSSIIGIDELVKKGIIKNIDVKVKKGEVFNGDMSSKERIASFIMISNDYSENQEKLKTVLNTIEVLDTSGNPIMRKDIYD